MSSLADQRCVPCHAKIPPLKGAELKALAAQVPGWQVVKAKRLAREFKFTDFSASLAFVNAVGAIAEAEGHHPDLFFTWGRARVEIWTHSIGGLSEADFVLAAKISRIAM